jgi:hypothetical protein
MKKMTIDKCKHKAIQLLFLSLVFACTEPVRRTTTPPAKVASANEQDIGFEDIADLKKSVWVFEFKNEATVQPPRLAKIPVARMLQEELIAAFDGAKSAFTAQKLDEEKSFFTQPKTSLNAPEVAENLKNKNNEIEVDEIWVSQNPAVISRALRGSDVSGFLLGRIIKLETESEGDKSEGIMKLRSLSLTLQVFYELYDTSTGKIIAQGREREVLTETRSDIFGVQPEISDLPVKVQKMAQNIALKIRSRLTPFSVKLAWGGRVLKIEGGRIYINAGRKAGLAIGDTLRIVERSREIVDPQTGDFIGEAPGRLKGTLKLIQFFGTDGAVGVLQSGGGIQSGDRVELY